MSWRILLNLVDLLFRPNLCTASSLSRRFAGRQKRGVDETDGRTYGTEQKVVSLDIMQLIARFWIPLNKQCRMGICSTHAGSVLEDHGSRLTPSSINSCVLRLERADFVKRNAFRLA